MRLAHGAHYSQRMSEEMPPKPCIAILQEPERVAHAAARFLQTIAFNSLKKKPLFTMALSGGSTPLQMFRLLATDPRLSNFPWHHTHLFWVDERCVPFDDSNSNFGNTSTILLEKVPIPGKNIHPMSCYENPEQGSINYEKEIRSFFNLSGKELPSFDLILLGVGKDGHTASIFPESMALEEKKRLVLAVTGGEPQVTRITLTLPVLNNAKQVLFMATGKEKAEIFAQIVAGGPCELPAAMVRPASKALFWMVDREAASIFLSKGAF